VQPRDSRATKAAHSFANAFDPRNNAFNFLRLVLALLVLVGHCFPLGGFGPEQPVPALTGGRYSLGTLAVGMFFLLSGFLISRSATSGLSLGRFLWHRFLRIFPGYWACLLVCAFLFAPIFCAIEYGWTWDIFFGPKNTPQSFAIDNALMFRWRGWSMNSVMAIGSTHIAGLLNHNPSPWTMNGSLWSLPIELLCYLAVAVLAALGLIQRKPIVVGGMFAVLLGIRELSWANPDAYRRCFPFLEFTNLSDLSFYFFAGCVGYLYRDRIPFSKVWFIGASSLAVLGLLFVPLGFLVPVALPYSFLCLSFTLSTKRLKTKGDYSYGTYIYAFPVQQGLALLGLHKAGFGIYLLSSVLVTAILAVLSYHYIEAPCLRWKSFDLTATLKRWFGAPLRDTTCLTAAPKEFQPESAYESLLEHAARTSAVAPGN
jgi:peptidoglycan/LPS O-acetylase OafA/YrhL